MDFTFTVTGIVRGSYVDRKTGNSKPFTRLYLLYDFDEAKYSSCDVIGRGCESVFISHIIDDIQLGDIVRPIYNKYGSCVDIQIL